MLGKTNDILNRGFWSDRATLEIDEPGIDEPEKIRILVCGNTGVGKSTLINRIFGVGPSNEIVCHFRNLKLISPLTGYADREFRSKARAP